MTDTEVLEGQGLNAVAQWGEDLKKRPSITPTQQYNQAVAGINGLHESGAISPSLTKEEAGQLFWTAVGSLGYSAVGVLYGTHEDDYITGDWPIPLAV